MAEDKKIDYSKVKTHGGVTCDEDGAAVPTALSDQSRAAQIGALRDERELLAQRVKANDEDGHAKSRLGEVDRVLEKFGASPKRTSKETASSTPPAR